MTKKQNVTNIFLVSVLPAVVRPVEPRLVLVFPHIEQGRPGFLAHPIQDPNTAAKAAFDNISQKIAESVVLYDSLAVPGFDDAAAAGRRLAASRALIEHGSVERIFNVLSNPVECWGNLLT